MFWRAYPQGSASIAALAGGEIGANRQVCPTIGGGRSPSRLLRIRSIAPVPEHGQPVFHQDGVSLPDDFRSGIEQRQAVEVNVRPRSEERRVGKGVDLGGRRI